MVDQSATFGDNENTIGDNNTIGGNVNQGNINESVNTNTASTGTGSGTGNLDGAFDSQAFLTNKIDQQVDQSRTFGDNENKIGDYNKIYGNLNQGNQDFSVNINSASIGSGGNTSGLTNMQSSEAYKALNENAYERSNAKFSAAGRSQMAIDLAEDNLKS